MPRSLLLFAAAAGTAQAIDNGLGRTPPMGWRSWNLFGANVNQTLMQEIMDGMVSKKRSVDGVPTSLCDLGYCDVGLDDNWQDCKGGHKYSYHDDSGKPIVELTRFPNMTAMTGHAHQLGLTAGWYGNNCICREHTATDAMYEAQLVSKSYGSHYFAPGTWLAVRIDKEIGKKEPRESPTGCPKETFI